MKLEVIDGKATNWGGLWWQPDSLYFTSQTISLSELRKFKGCVRLVVKKNKFYNNGENGRPNYVFLFRDAKSENPFTLEVTDETVDEVECEDSLQSKVDELAEIMRSGHDGSEYRMLPSESQARAKYLFNEAISLVEEITGEKWEFAYTYF